MPLSMLIIVSSVSLSNVSLGEGDEGDPVELFESDHESSDSVMGMSGTAPRISVASNEIFKKHPLKESPKQRRKSDAKKKSEMTEVEMTEMIERRSNESLMS